MKTLRTIIISTIVLLLMGCSNLSREKDHSIGAFDKSLGVQQTFNLGFLCEISPQLHESLLKEPSQIIILFFDASCSACVAAFLEYLDKVKINKDITYLYVGSTNNDLLLVEHYIDQYARKLMINEYLLPDITSAYSRYNPTIETQLLPLITLDKDLEVFGAISLYNFE